jgi:hypothetical protein
MSTYRMASLPETYESNVNGKAYGRLPFQQQLDTHHDLLRRRLRSNAINGGFLVQGRTSHIYSALSRTPVVASAVRRFEPFMCARMKASRSWSTSSSDIALVLTRRRELLTFSGDPRFTPFKFA